jgi:type II secretory pathway component GspD/PulD (secretin)
VSNPTIVSLSNQEALIDVTTRFPIILTTSTPGASGPTISETREIEEFGVKLRVTPQIRPGSIVSLAVTPEVSSLQREIESASGNNYPVVDRRSVTNRVNLRDGYTIALGGLVQTRTSLTTSRVPVLGSIPGIGGLFRSKAEEEDSRNLIIFITARIIDASGNLSGEATNENFDTLVPDTANPRALRNLGPNRESIPGYRP